MEEFVVRINTNLESIDWSEIAATTEKCQWRGSELDKRHINEHLVDFSDPWTTSGDS